MIYKQITVPITRVHVGKRSEGLKKEQSCSLMEELGREWSPEELLGRQEERFSFTQETSGIYRIEPFKQVIQLR